MHINTELLKNKQRILIGGNEGASEIFDLLQKILVHIKKPADFITLGGDISTTDAPIVIIRGDTELKDGQKLDIHILLVHKITESIPESYASFEEYVSQWEELADNLPKAGTFLYFEDDNVATILGKKEREDVKNLEYSALASETVSEGLKLKSDDFTATIKTDDENFPAYAAAAKALLNRIGVSDEQIFSALKSL